MAGERLVSRFSLRRLLRFRWTGKCFETATSHMQNVSPHLLLVRFWCIFTSKQVNMSRQSISFTEPNNDWLNSLVESKEYSSKSEIINDLIRKARESAKEVEFIRMKLALAEKSGFYE